MHRSHLSPSILVLKKDKERQSSGFAEWLTPLLHLLVNTN